MEKKKKVIFWVAGVVLALAVLIIAGNIFIEKKIKSAIQKNLKEQNVSYNEVSFSLLGANSSIDNPRLQKKNFSFSARKIALNNLDYSQYIFHHKIVIGNLKISNPVFLLKKNDSVAQKEEDSSTASFKKSILIREMNITDGLLKSVKNDSIQIYLRLNSLKMGGTVLNSETLKERLPFNYDDVQFDSDSIYYKLSDLHYITISNLKFKNKDLSVKDFKLLSQHDKVDFQKQISVQHDWYHLLIDSIKVEDFKWQFVHDSLQLESPFTRITDADFHIFRNKLQPEDTSVKPLYSKMLRESKARLKFDSIEVKNSRIVYEEKEVADRKAGEVAFENLNANLSHVQNINPASGKFPKTEVHAKAQFMGASPLVLNLEFLVEDKNDNFHASGSLGTLSAAQMNPFLVPFKNIKAEGEIESLFYNIYGDNDKASGDMNLKYNNFRIKILKKNSKEKNSFLTGIVNLIVKNHAKEKDEVRRDVTAQRDHAKSFWNYLWTFIRNGALKSFIKF